jgi:hypothetical protein
VAVKATFLVTPSTRPAYQRRLERGGEGISLSKQDLEVKPSRGASHTAERSIDRIPNPMNQILTSSQGLREWRVGYRSSRDSLLDLLEQQPEDSQGRMGRKNTDIARCNFFLSSFLRQGFGLDEWEDDLLQDDGGVHPSRADTVTNESLKCCSVRALTGPGRRRRADDLLEDRDEIFPQQLLDESRLVVRGGGRAL